MKTLFLILIVLIFIIMLTKKENFMHGKKESLIYQTAAQLGIDYLENYKTIPKRAAVMFDIDDTLLAVNPNNQLSEITPIINLLNYCIIRDILVFIITARDNTYRQHTVNDLARFGINYSYLYLRKSPEDDNNLFKSRVKERLTKEHGIMFLMSVGDNLIDIVGDYSGYCLKLPNKSDPKLYHVPLGEKQLIEVQI
jgi:predicted secreted acid phosphatase